MQFVCCLFALAVSVVSGRTITTFETPGIPITEVRTSYGQDDHERVTYIKAIIRPSHVNRGERTNFPPSGHLDEYFRKGAAVGDERGHLVASQFSGPADWYNLSPQNSRVNRNEGYRAITVDWYGTECEVRRFLDPPAAELPIPERYVVWEVSMTYNGKSNRADTFHLQVAFFEGGKDVKQSIDTLIPNPLVRADDRVYICRLCGATRHFNDELRAGKVCKQAPPA